MIIIVIMCTLCSFVHRINKDFEEDFNFKNYKLVGTLRKTNKMLRNVLMFFTVCNVYGLSSPAA